MSHHCPACRSGDLVSVAIAPAGATVEFFHCRDCEHRFWIDSSNGRELELGEALGLVAA